MDYLWLGVICFVYNCVAFSALTLCKMVRMALLTTTLSNVAIFLVEYVNHKIIYLYVKSYMCSSTYVALSDHVRL